MTLVLSLFPGIGLLDSAFEQEGYCVVRGPDVIWGGDIRTFHPPSGKFDGIIGGPPCQSFSSLVHLVRANGHEPRFGNLIPEYERCVLESQPAWFLMENVPQAPEPVVPGYGVTAFLLDNSHLLAGEDGFGQEQRRVRKFCFGMRGVERPPNLMRWIDLAVFFLPDAGKCVTSRDKARPMDGKGSKVRQVAVTSTDGGARPSEMTERKRVGAVSSSASGKGKNRPRDTPGQTKQGRYKLADAVRLQGLPEGFLSNSPFTADGKLKAVANGVPIPMGRAIARAILEATK